MDRIYQIHKLPANSKTIKKIEDLTEVKSMLETNTKNWEKASLRRVLRKIRLISLEKMVLNGMNNTDIRKITGMSLNKITQIRRKITKK